MTRKRSSILITTAVASVLAFGGVMGAGLLNSSDDGSGDIAVSGDPAAAAVLERDPDNPQALARLAEATQLEARQSGDPELGEEARRLAEAALEVDPDNFQALDTLARLANSRHEFAEGLELAERSQEVAPDRLAPLSIAGDSLIELGRYERAFATVEERLDTRPDLSSYAQSSYASELQGEVDNAVLLMELAADSGVPGGFPREFARTQLAFLRIRAGQLDAAERDLSRLEAESPGNPEVVIGRARIAAAREQYDRAAELYSEGIEELPDADHFAEFADVQEALGNDEEAERLRQEALAALELLAEFEDIGVERALLVADVREPTAEEVAAAREARERRPSILGDQALGWTLVRAGQCEEGDEILQQSLRTGIRDPLFRFRAGVAAACAGNQERAERHLEVALEENPNFSPRWAPVARDVLAGESVPPDVAPRG